MQNRIIFHIDMNSYFASCEQQANPHLRGKPVGVCEHLGGIIIAPSVEAKRAGVKTAMRVFEARRLCPDITLLPTDPPKYRAITERFMKIFTEYAESVERYSIDEAFLDVTGRLCSSPHKDEEIFWRDAQILALEIKWRIRREIGEWLTCSVGAGPNKLVAKIASDMDKPDGVVIVPPERLPELTRIIRITDVPGIAGHTARKLGALGIVNLSDLATYPEVLLRSEFGIFGHWLARAGRLEGAVELVAGVGIQKSVGHSYTLPVAAEDERMVLRLLAKLSEKVARRLRKKNFIGYSVQCHVRMQKVRLGSAVAGEQAMEAGEWYASAKRLGQPTDSGREIFEVARTLYFGFPFRLPVRSAGVSVSEIIRRSAQQPLLDRYRRQERAQYVADKINDKYGEFTIRPGILVGTDDLAGDTIGFGRVG